MAAYVRYMEASGARVVPIIYDEPFETIKEKLSHIDAVLFPGGDGDYLDMGGRIFDEIIRMNDEGTFYPAWGTCLGYESILSYTTKAGLDILNTYDIHKVSLPLKFTKDPQNTKMYEGLGAISKELELGNYTYNSHTFGVRPDVFDADEDLKQFWDVTAHSFMPNGTAFIASVEAKDYPIFATQYHPEKPTQDWFDGKNINHSHESIELQQHFSKVFVDMARANPNTFGNFSETDQHVISNYEVINTLTAYSEVYAF